MPNNPIAAKLAAALRPFVDFADKQDSRYRRRGGNPDTFPDTHPFTEIHASDLRMGLWRKAREALREYDDAKGREDQPVAQAVPWQPIETAPKDSQVLLAAYIIPSDVAQANGSRNHWTYGIGSHLWDDQWSGILGSTPSHWKPLEPPK